MFLYLADLSHFDISRIFHSQLLHRSDDLLICHIVNKPGWAWMILFDIELFEFTEYAALYLSAVADPAALLLLGVLSGTSLLCRPVY